LTKKGDAIRPKTGGSRAQRDKDLGRRSGDHMRRSCQTRRDLEKARKLQHCNFENSQGRENAKIAATRQEGGNLGEKIVVGCHLQAGEREEAGH